MSPVSAELAALFDALGCHYGNKDFPAVRALWLPDLETPFYIAEEHGEVMTSWEQIERYWRITSESLAHLRARFEPRGTVPLSATQQLVGFDLTWLARVGSTAPVAGTLRAIAICEQTTAGWRIRAWVEAPLAPIVYMRALYEGVARQVTVDQQGEELR
ncbi:MAG: nuclear transport factor 2 family protein [Steroidobacteraceae bacterium]